MRRTAGRERQRSVEREYRRLAPEYDERWASYIAASIDLTLSRLPEGVRFSRIADVGCGTGALLAPLASRFPSAALLGADPSLSMLQVARRRLAARAALVAARAEALPLRDGRFDLLASTSSLHYFSDVRAAVVEMHRVIEPGGTALITDWCRDYVTVRVFERVMRVLGRANFTVLGSGDCERLLRDAGFEDVVVETRRISALWGLMAVTARKRNGRRSP